MKTMKLCNLQYEKRSHQGYVYDQKPYPGGGRQMGTTSHVPLQLLPCFPPPIGRFYPTSLLPRFSSSTSHLPLNFCRHPASLMHCPPFAYPNNPSLVYEKKNSQRGVRDRDFTVPLSPHLYQTDGIIHVFRHFHSV